jgi:CYTH domain-containing protein
MAIEIERRFLVRDPRAAIDGAGAKPSHIVQGYFGCVDNLRVRVRILAKERDACMAFLTFKGPRRGLCRLEFEYPLELTRARRALNTLPPTRVIQKTRYEVPNDGLAWSVDSFEGPNIGLVLAEIELAHPSQEIKLPPWVGEEVTFNSGYRNSRLAISPMPSRLADAA